MVLARTSVALLGAGSLCLSLTLRPQCRRLRFGLMNRLFPLRRLIVGLPLLAMLSACVSLRDHGELRQPAYVDISRITQGVWYVQGYLPTVADGDTYNATYEFNQRRDGSLRVVYAYNTGSLDGPIRNREFRADIDDTTTNLAFRS